MRKIAFIANLCIVVSMVFICFLWLFNHPETLKDSEDLFYIFPEYIGDFFIALYYTSPYIIIGLLACKFYQQGKSFLQLSLLAASVAGSILVVAAFKANAWIILCFPVFSPLVFGIIFIIANSFLKDHYSGAMDNAPAGKSKAVFIFILCFVVLAILGLGGSYILDSKMSRKAA